MSGAEEELNKTAEANESEVAGRSTGSEKAQSATPSKTKRTPEEEKLLKQLLRHIDGDAQRVDNRAGTVQRLIQINPKYESATVLARTLGVTPPTVYHLYDYLKCIPAVREACRQRKVRLTDAYKLGRLPAAEQERLLKVFRESKSKTPRQAKANFKKEIEGSLGAQAPARSEPTSETKPSELVATITTQIREIIKSHDPQLQPEERKALAKSLREIAREQTEAASMTTEAANA